MISVESSWPRRLEFGQQAADAVIHAQQRLGVALVVLADVEVGVVGEVDAVPGIPLVLDPAPADGAPSPREAAIVAGGTNVASLYRPAWRGAGTNSEWTALCER